MEVSFLVSSLLISSQRGHDLQAKLSEMETYREILCRQIDTLQVYFDTLAEANAQGEVVT